jgi:CBS domain containing-hemolysin-like protein
MTLLLFYLLLALVVSFLCSVLEAVLLSVTPSYIQGKLNQNKAWAKRLFAFKKDIDRPLAAILSLNTISHTVGAAGVGAQAGVVFSNVSVGIISGVLTLLILVVSELIPKTIGANYWKSLARFTTQTLVVLNVLMYPLVWLAQIVTKLFKKQHAPSVERSEVVALAEIGEKEGVFTKEEALILKNLMRLRSLTVRDVMTPRMVMVAANQNLSVQAFFEAQEFYRFTRIPLYGKNKDDITGFVHKHDILSEIGAQRKNTPLKNLKRELPVVPDVQSLFTLYSFLTQNNHHLALVVEEFGGTAGLITMEDVLETLLGMEIMDEFDSKEDLRAYARERWKIRAQRLGIALEENQNKD